jgi:hypothetical protein
MYHITRIHGVQTGLERRGGIFISRDWFALDTLCLSHKDYIRMWRVAKIECWRAVEILEGLRNESPTQVQEWSIIKALELWAEAEEECGKVPGCSYVQGEDKEKEGDADGDADGGMEAGIGQELKEITE